MWYSDAQLFSLWVSLHFSILLLDRGGNFSWRNILCRKITWPLKGKGGLSSSLEPESGNLEAWRWLGIPARDHGDVSPWPCHITTVWHLLGAGSHSNWTWWEFHSWHVYFSAPQTFHKVLLNLPILFASRCLDWRNRYVARNLISPFKQQARPRSPTATQLRLRAPLVSLSKAASPWSSWLTVISKCTCCGTSEYVGKGCDNFKKRYYHIVLSELWIWRAGKEYKG